MVRLIAGLLLIIGMNAYACEPHFYFQAHAGKQGQWTDKSDGQNWDGTKSVAAIFRVGYKHPVNNWLSIGAEAAHNSHWDKGEPFDDNGESYLDSATVFVELRY